MLVPKLPLSLISFTIYKASAVSCRQEEGKKKKKNIFKKG